MIRIGPIKLFRSDFLISDAGFSCVCLLPSFRRKGLSIPLLGQSITYCKKRNFDITLLFARSAADIYYTQFGVYGVFSLPRVFIKRHSQSLAN